MSSLPSSLHPDFAHVPGLDTARERRQPFANVALAITRLRGEHGLTQTEFANRIGTTQSVVARLESGRHGIQISLLNRIGAAFAMDWTVQFGHQEEAAADPEPEARERAEPSGDELLDAFNWANTRRDFATAHKHATKIAKEPSSPRRELALALDAFNHGHLRIALRRSQAALAGTLPSSSRDVACVVAGRTLLGLNRPAEALEVLSDADEGLHARAALAETHMELGELDRAIELTEALLADADPDFVPAAEFLAARVYWHADRPLEALRHIGAYRAHEPNDRLGTLLNGAILGHLGDLHSDTSAYELAFQLFERVADNHPETLRLLAMTAARLGRWHDALTGARHMVEARPKARRKYARSAERIAIECLDRLTNVDELEGALALTAELDLINPAALRSRQAYAQAMRGEFAGAVSALGLRPDTLDQAAPEDQVRCASAFAVRSNFGAAYPILRRNMSALSVPDGQLFLAQSALAVQDSTTARHALKRITEVGSGSATETAKVALDLVLAIEKSGQTGVLTGLRLQSEDWLPEVIGSSRDTSAPGSAWEGPVDHSGEPTHDVASAAQRFATDWMLPRAA